MNFDELKNPELQEKLQKAQTPDELLAIAKEEGYELSEDQLEGVNGGWCVHCPQDDCPPVGGTMSIG